MRYEIFKFENITNEIVELKKQMSLDTEKDLDKMKNNIKQADEKYKNKITMSSRSFFFFIFFSLYNFRKYLN